MHRAVVLASLLLLLLAVAGVTAAQESGSFVAGPNSDAPTESSMPERTLFESTLAQAPETTAPGGASSKPEDLQESDEDASEPTILITKPTVGRAKESTMADPVDVNGHNAGKPGNNGRGVGRPELAGRPEHVGKPSDIGNSRSHGEHPGIGKPEERGDEDVHGRGEGQRKVTLCHKAKNALTVGAPAYAAHLKHDDRLGAC